MTRGTAVPVNDGNHPKRLFIGCISNQVIPHPHETQRAAGQVSPAVSLMREWNTTFEGLVNVRDYAVGGADAIGSDVFPNLIKIGLCPRVEIVPGHEPGFALRASLFSRSRAKTSSPGISFTLPLLRSS